MSVHLTAKNVYWSYFFAGKIWFLNPTSVNGSLPINPHNLPENMEYDSGNQGDGNYITKYKQHIHKLINMLYCRSPASRWIVFYLKHEKNAAVKHKLINVAKMLLLWAVIKMDIRWPWLWVQYQRLDVTYSSGL